MDIITSHIGCDFDGLAAMVAASKLYPEAKLYLSGAPSREVREFLRLYRWMLPLETYRQSDLVHIKRLIIVDTRLMSRIGPFADLIGKQGVTVHLYDHHPPHPQDLKGDGGKSMEAGAATSILVSLLHERAIPINSFEATLFLLGIYEDTGSLRFSSTTPFDLRAVAYLLEKGAKLEYMAKFLDHGLTERQDQLLKTFLEGARTRTIQGLEVAIVSAEVEDFVGGLSGPLHRFIDLRSPDVVFAIVRSRAKTYLLGRSHVPFVNVDEIAAMFGGGGHPFAASALVAGVKVGSIEERLWKTLEERARPYLSAGYVAARPQRIIYAHETIKDAYKTLCREDRVVAPVEEDGDVIGLIARDKLKVIVEHNSPQDPVRSYVTRKLPRVSSGVSLREAHQVMVEQQTPWLLVFGKDQFQGVLTSLDIFRAYRSFPYYEDLALLLEKRIPARIITVSYTHLRAHET